MMKRDYNPTAEALRPEQMPAEMAAAARALEAPIPKTLAVCESMVNRDVLKNFLEGQSPGGAPWTPRKRTPNPFHPLMRDTNALMNAATGFGPGHISENDGHTLVVGVDPGASDEGGIPGAAAHNYGFYGVDSLGRNQKLPKREFEGARPDTEVRMAGVIADGYLSEAGAF